MAQNPYYVEPANVLPGMQAAMQGALKGGMEEKKRNAMSEFAEKFQTMTPAEIGKYTLENPDVAEQVTKAVATTEGLQKEDKLAKSWDMITGARNPEEVLSESAEQKLSQGMDATREITLYEDALRGGDKALKGAYAFVASNDPKGFKTYMQATSPWTAQDATSEMKNWEKYAKLLKEDPEKAKQFGISAGIVQTQDFSPTTEDRYVEEVAQAYEMEHGKPMPPGLRAKARLEHKRAQASEVAATRFAERNVDAQTAEPIAYNERLGKRLAEISTQRRLMEAKGEIPAAEKQQQAKNRMTVKLSDLTKHYLDLDSMGAILNTENNTLDNILASAKSSGMGQFLGKITGSEAQSIRSKINKLKPLLIQDIRQSTDMSARGLDSEKELEFYLQAATDEKTDLQSNLAAIAVLDESFGTGEIAQQIQDTADPEALRKYRMMGEQILDGKVPFVTNKKEYDQLESGQLYIEKDSEGNFRQYRKP